MSVCLSHSDIVSKRTKMISSLTESPKTLDFADIRFIPNSQARSLNESGVDTNWLFTEVYKINNIQKISK